MTKRIDSDALGILNKALGLTGSGVPGPTELMDGTVDQVIAVNDLARRGRTQAATTGIYNPAMVNLSTGAETTTTTVNPYTNTVGIVAPWPAPVPEQFDVWLLGVAANQSGGTTWDAALYINPPDAQQGWGVDQSGAAAVSSIQYAVAYFDATATATHTFGVTAGGELPWQPIGIRLPRGATLIWVVDHADVSTVVAQLTLGLFPIALGQDVVV